MLREKGQALKEHIKEHKEAYLGFAAGIGVAGITFLIMRDRHAGLIDRVQRGLQDHRVHAISFLNSQDYIFSQDLQEREYMPRLEPLSKTKSDSTIMLSANISKDLMDKLDNEVERIGSSGRAETIRLILEQYFSEEVAEEVVV